MQSKSGHIEIFCRILLVMVFGLFFSFLHAQNIPTTEEEARTELEKKGINEEELRKRLNAEGIDLDNLQNLTPDQFLRMEAIIAEMEAEAASTDTIDVNTNKELSPDDGKVADPVKKEEKVVQERPQLDANGLPPAEIYGQQFFRDNSIILQRQTKDLKAPGNYILGVGDEILVSIWGRSQLDAEYRINNDGFIRILNGNQRVFLKGLTLDSARSKLRNTFAQYYNFRSGEFDVNLNTARAVTINILGEVFNPGSVRLSAANTAFNALIAANGPNNLGSVRNIMLVLNEGGNRNVDLYQYLNNPSSAGNLYISEGDLIYVPIAEKVITLQGAVRRPFKYELKGTEGLKRLIAYAGGLKENAYRSKIMIERFENDQRRQIDVDFSELNRRSGDFALLDGDVVIVEELNVDIENFVAIKGSVIDDGVFERTDDMTIVDLVNKAGLRSNAYTDIAFLIRTNPDGTKTFEKINLANILSNPSSGENLRLENKDELTIWSQERFTDQQYITIGGAVRNPDEYSYDVSQNIRIADAILLSGGLRRDAAQIGVIHRADPLNPQQKVYIRVDVLDAVNNPGGNNNIVLQPFDRLEVLSQRTFTEDATVSIQGAVNNPGDFQYGDQMTIRDLLLLGGGFKLAAATNKIEVSRTIIRDNEPTKTIIANISVDRDLNTVNTDNNNFVLEPYDIVFVRYVPEFEFQQNISIEGEVSYPGTYSLINDNEKIRDLIGRAGGLTQEAFPAGATLYRNQDSIGYIVMRLDEVMSNPQSRYNFILKNGDRIMIPKQIDFVTIAGATKVHEVYQNEVIDEDNSVKVAFHRGKNAKFYIDNYAGGLHENADRKLVFVQHPNGEIEKTKSILFFRKYPSVRKGSVIRVGFKPPQTQEEKEKAEVDWTKVIGDSVAQAMSVLTLILLIQSLD